MEAANAVRSVVTTYQGVNSTWPTNKHQLTSGGGDPIAKLPSEIVFSCTAPTGSSPSIIQAIPRIDGSSNIIGYTINYWDYAPTSGSPRVMAITVGDTTSGTNRGAVSNDAAIAATPCT